MAAILSRVGELKMVLSADSLSGMSASWTGLGTYRKFFNISYTKS